MFHVFRKLKLTCEAWKPWLVHSERSFTEMGRGLSDSHRSNRAPRHIADAETLLRTG